MHAEKTDTEAEGRGDWHEGFDVGWEEGEARRARRCGLVRPIIGVHCLIRSRSSMTLRIMTRCGAMGVDA